MGDSLDERESAIRRRSWRDQRGYWISFGVIVLGFVILFLAGPGRLRGVGAGIGIVGIIALMVFATRSSLDDIRSSRLRREKDLDRAYEQRDKFI